VTSLNEPFQAIDCTVTDNQTQNNLHEKKHTKLTLYDKLRITYKIAF